MKIFIAGLLILSLIGCSKSTKTTNPPDPNKKEFILEGTVVKIFNLLIPQAQATSFAVLLSGSTKDCDDADKCAFLVEVKEEGEFLIAVTPVVNQRFKFSLSSPLPPEGIFKVVVRGWNPKEKKPILGKADREMAFLGKEINGPIEVNPESTFTSRRRVEVLKSNKQGDPSRIVQELLDKLLEIFQVGMESLREVLTRLLDASDEPIEDLVVAADKGEESSGLLAEVELRRIRALNISSLNILAIPLSEVLQLMDLVNRGLVLTHQAQERIANDLFLREGILDNGAIIAALDFSMRENEIESLRNQMKLQEDPSNEMQLSSQILNQEMILTYLQEDLISISKEMKNSCRGFVRYQQMELIKEELLTYKSLIDIENEHYLPIKDSLMGKLNFSPPMGSELSSLEQINIKQLCSLEKEGLE